MKILALVCLFFGISAAIPLGELERAKDEAISRFVLEMEHAPSLQEIMDLDLQELNEVDEEIKTELVKAFRDALSHLLQRMKDTVDHGKKVTEEMKEHFEKIKAELHKLGKTIGSKAIEALERLKDLTKGKITEWLKKMIGWEYSEAYEVAFTEEKVTGKLRDILLKLREKLRDTNEDFQEVMKEFIKKLREHGSMIAKMLEKVVEGGREKVKKVLEIFLGKEEDSDIEDIIGKVKNYNKERREVFPRFFDWLKKVYESGYEAAKSKFENMKKLARKFVEHAKQVGKETADEALEFFRPYKEDLGTLWDQLEKAVKDAYGKHH